MYHLAQAAPESVARLQEADVGPIKEIPASELRGTMEFDQAIRVIGDVKGRHLHVIADHIEVMGSVTGENVWLHARAKEDRAAENVWDAQVNEGKIIIHGDVTLTDSHLGAAGTSQILINGHANFWRFATEDYGRGGGHLMGQEVCVTGNFSSNYGSSVIADNFSVGRNILGSGLEGYAYTHPITEDHPGRTVVGGQVDASDVTLTNGEIALGRQGNGAMQRFRAYKQGEPITQEEADCGFEPRPDRPRVVASARP